MIMSRSESGHSASKQFYAGLLSVLNEAGIPYLVGGTSAINEYIGLGRPTKDLDIFCRASDFPRLINTCSTAGYEVKVEDERWIAKIERNEHFCDVIFGSANMVAPVTDDWFREEHPYTIYGISVHLLPPTELVWSKLFIMDRYKFDGNDVVHILLRNHHHIDWQRLMMHGDQHWEVLLMHIIRFRYIYPAERNLIPDWVFDQLLQRLMDQRGMPRVRKKVCRGRAFSRDDFNIDVTEWGYADLVGEVGEMMRSRDQGEPEEDARINEPPRKPPRSRHPSKRSP